MPPKSAVVHKYHCVAARRATFTDGIRIGSAKSLKYWPHDTPSPEDMAEVGFYYTPTKTLGDQVTCFWCGKKEKGLGGQLSVSSIHYSHSKRCPYAVIYHFLAMYENDSDMATFWNRLLAENESPLSVLEPHSEQSIKLRLSTFRNLWKVDPRRKTKVTARGMARAGFFFAPADVDDDRVICMYCGCPLSDWDLGDDPLQEHENNSRQFRGENSQQPTCYFLATMAEPEAEPETVEQYELQYIPEHTKARSMSSPISGSTPEPIPESLPAAEAPDSPLAKADNVLDEILSPSSGDEGPSNEFDKFDISIDQLSDHGTHLDKQPVRRYPRRRKQVTFPPKKEYEKTDAPSSTSLILEVRKEPEIGEGEEDSGDSSNASDNVDVSDDLNVSNAPDVSEGSEAAEGIESYSIQESVDISAPLDESSLFQEINSSSLPQDTEDGDYAESLEEIASPKVAGSSVKAEMSKKQRSRFSDNEFGLDEKDIARILNSPKKDRKMKVVKKVSAVPVPALHDLSDQNLGDYDDQNLSYIEKDVMEPVREEKKKKVDLGSQHVGPRSENNSERNSQHDTHRVPDSSLMEITKPVLTTRVPETILIESPEKSHSAGETSVNVAENRSMLEEASKEKDESGDVMALDLDPLSDDLLSEITSQEASEESSVESETSHKRIRVKQDGKKEVKEEVKTEPKDVKKEVKEQVKEIVTKQVEKEPKDKTNERIEESVREGTKMNSEVTQKESEEETTLKTTTVSKSADEMEIDHIEEKSDHSVQKYEDANKSFSTAALPQTVNEVKVGKMENHQHPTIENPTERNPRNRRESKTEDSNLYANLLHSSDTIKHERAKRNTTPVSPEPVARAGQTRTSNDSSLNVSAQSHENSKRALSGSEVPVAKKAKTEDRNSPLGGPPKLEHNLGSLALGEKGPNLAHSPNQFSKESEVEESPTKSVVISPSSYKEYMADFRNMGDEFTHASREEAANTANDVSKEKANNVTSMEEANSKQTGPDTDGNNTLHAQERERNSGEHLAYDSELILGSDLPSYIGDSASEAPPLLSMSPAKRPDPTIKREVKNYDKAGSVLTNEDINEPGPHTGHGPENDQEPRKVLGSPNEGDSSYITKETSGDGKPEKLTSGSALSEKLVTTKSVTEKSESEKSVTEEMLPEKSIPEESARDSNLMKVLPSDSHGNLTHKPEDNARLSFSDIKSSTPLKTQSESANISENLSRVSVESALAELKELDDAIDYITDVAEKGYELHNDVDGGITNFISAMPEEEEEMAIEEWIRHNAASCRRIVEESGRRIIHKFAAEFDRVIDYVDQLDTID